MGLPKDYSPLLKAVAHILLLEQLNGRLVDVNLLVAPLNSLGSGGINDNAMVDADMIKTAFTQRPAVGEYELPYSHINIGEGGERVLVARIGVRRDSTNKNAPRVTEFGCFNSLEEGLSEDLVATKSITTEGSTINIGSAEYPFAIPFNAATSLLPTAVQDSLVTFLKDKPFNRSANSTQPKKKQKTKEQSEQQQLAAANNAFLRDTDKLETAEELVERYREIVKRRDDYINDINKKRDVYTNRCLACVDKAKANTKQHTDFIKNKLATLREEPGDIDIPSALDQTQAKDDDKDTSNTNSSSQLLFIHRGRCGKMPIPASGVIFLDELEDGLLPLQSNGNNGNNNDANNESTLDQRRAKVNYERDNHGSGECWVPRGSVAKAIAVLNRLEESHNMVCKLANVFEGKQCGFDPFIRQYFTAASITGYGCSDEAAILMKTTTLKCVLLVMTSPGDAKPTKLSLHDVTNKQISKAVQSRATLKSDEHQLAADCMLVSRQELIDDKAKFRDNKSMLLGGQFDHGERNNLQQYPKLGDWAGVCSETGKKTIKTRCIDVDACSHGAIACAESIKHSFKEFLKGIDAELYFAMGDTGGGGAIQHIHPLLIENGAMPEDSKRGNCILHGFAKAYQRGNEDVWGTHGLFHNSPYQLLWMFPDIMKRSVRRFGRENHDEMWAKVAHKIIYDGVSQAEALKNHPQAYERLMRQVEEEECEPTKAPVDIQDAVFSRWSSVGETNEDFLEVYPIFYEFLIVIVNHVGPKCDLGMRCLTALSLMKTRAIPKVGEGIPIATTEAEASQLFVDDGSIDAIRLKPGDSPTFYTILLFAHGFYTYFYKDANYFFLKCDPVLGKGTHGFLARLLHERLYATHKKLSEIENGGWRNKDEFKRYLTALEGVSGEATLARRRARYTSNEQQLSSSNVSVSS